MTAFASFFVEFLWTLIKNIGNFFASIGIAIYDFFVRDVGEYFEILGDHSGRFDAFSWILLILVAVVNTVFVVFLIYRLAQLIRRYIIYRAKNVRKDKILEEVAKLQLKAEELSKEKGKIFSEKLKKEVEALLNKEESAKTATEAMSEKKKTDDSIRFMSLLEVDSAYEGMQDSIQMAEADLISLREIVDNAVAYSASQLKLYYEADTIRQFLAALATSKIVIIEGITGAGKTSLPRAMGSYFNQEPTIVSVLPDWRDRSDFLGYYDEFNRKFVETVYLKDIYEAGYRQEPDFVVLDEMNLARAEYYFSDFLALTDIPDTSEWKIDLAPAMSTNDPKNIAYGKLQVSTNIWFVGTANTDDTTFSISDDIYERAMTIQLNEKAERFKTDPAEPATCTADYLQTLFDRAQTDFPVSPDNMRRVEDLDTFMGQRFAVKFGTRLMKQLTQFVSVYRACGGKESDGIDIFICNKVLRKLVPLNLQFLIRELNDLIVWINRVFGGKKMPRSVEFLEVLQNVN